MTLSTELKPQKKLKNPFFNCLKINYKVHSVSEICQEIIYNTLGISFSKNVILFEYQITSKVKLQHYI